jgi:hypothetical protein
MQAGVIKRGRSSPKGAPTPDTTNTAARAPAFRPRPAGDGRASANRSPGLSHIAGRRHRAKAFRRAARPGSWATTACATPRYLIVPTLDHSLRLGARDAIGPELGRAGLDVEPSCSDAHRASIMMPTGEVDPSSRLLARRLIRFAQYRRRRGSLRARVTCLSMNRLAPTLSVASGS